MPLRGHRTMEISLAGIKPEYLYFQVKNIYFVFRNRVTALSQRSSLRTARGCGSFQRALPVFMFRFVVGGGDFVCLFCF